MLLLANEGYSAVRVGSVTIEPSQSAWVTEADWEAWQAAGGAGTLVLRGQHDPAPAAPPKPKAKSKPKRSAPPKKA